MAETAIVANVDKTVNPSEQVFRFKKDKLGNKRADIKLTVYVPSVDGIVDILSRGDVKEVQLLLDSCNDVVRAACAGIIGDDDNVTAENFPYDKVTWAAIAAQPKEDRRSSSISDEAWTSFASSYITYMPGATGKSEEAVTNATLVYRKKFAPWKSDKKTLEKLKSQLAIYIDGCPEAEQHQEILDMLLRRVDVYLSADDLVSLAQNL
jgi:hypothetical protein